MKENKIFPWVIAISAISISFSAAFYSIFGIGKMFAGASTNVMIMAASLEFAKLVIASFLYRYWEDVNKVLRTYLVVACLILIGVTSAGIYGFLSSAYQETANKVEVLDKNTGVLQKQKEMIERQLAQAEKQLEYKNQRQNTISDIRSRQQTNADNLIAQNKSSGSIRTQMSNLSKESSQIDTDIKIIQDTIASKNKQISDLEIQILSISSNNDLANEIGPLKYIAKLTGKTLDQVVNWFIIALMLVFDPLAISLVIAANYAFSKINKNKDKNIEEEKQIKIDEPVEILTKDDKNTNEEIQKNEIKNNESDEVVNNNKTHKEEILEKDEYQDEKEPDHEISEIKNDEIKENIQEVIKEELPEGKENLGIIENENKNIEPHNELTIEDAINTIVSEENDILSQPKTITPESAASLGTSGTSVNTQENFGGYKVMDNFKIMDNLKKKTKEVVSVNNPIRLR